MHFWKNAHLYGVASRYCYWLALGIGVPSRRINEIVLGKRRITTDTALRLGRYFDMSVQFWVGLQMDYDLDVTADKLAERLERKVRPYAAVG